MRRLLMAFIAVLAFTAAAKAGDLGSYVFPFSELVLAAPNLAPSVFVKTTTNGRNWFYSNVGCSGIANAGELCTSAFFYPQNSGTITYNQYLVDCDARQTRLIGTGTGITEGQIQSSFVRVDGAVIAFAPNANPLTIIAQSACAKKQGVPN